MADPKEFGRPIPQGIIQRIVSGVQYVFTGKASFFPPMEPLQPVVQDAVETGAWSRQWDYASGLNLQIVPRQGELNEFAMLRGVAQQLDIMGLIIETCKDEMCSMEWEIHAKKGENLSRSRLKELNDFFAYPDRVHAWDEWLRMLLDDVYVIDAGTILPRMDKGKKVYSLDIMDGSMFKPMIDVTGRIPLPPAPAYLQVLKGVPAVYYTIDELLYWPRNRRVYKLYGFGPVEQTILTINIALRRAIHKLQYYTDGSVPDYVFQCPEGWTVDQIKQFDVYFNSMMSGNTAERRKAKFVPAGMKPIDTKEHALKDDFDEWIARVLCYALSRSPTPFMKQVNRATAEEAAEAAKREGNMPYMRWTTLRINYILAKYFQAGDCEFEFRTERDADPLVQAQIDKIYVDIGVQQPEQIADARGLEYIPPEEPPQVEPYKETELVQAPGTVSADDADTADKNLGKLAAAKHLRKSATSADKKKRLDPVPFERPATKRAMRKVKKTVGAFLKKEGARIAAQLAAAYRMLQKSSKKKTPLDDAIDGLDFDGWSVLWEPVSGDLQDVYEDSGISALAQMGIEDEGITDLVMTQAVTYAQDRAAQLVGMKYVDGELVENPNALFAITETTRDMLRQIVADSLETGPSPNDLAKTIEESTAFSGARSEMIARTELAMAHSEGALDGYREARGAGVAVYKEWLDSDGCEECSQNADAGAIDLDELFPSGDECPPAHPNCRCAISPVVISAEDVEEGEEPYK